MSRREKPQKGNKILLVLLTALTVAALAMTVNGALLVERVHHATQSGLEATEQLLAQASEQASQESEQASQDCESDPAQNSDPESDSAQEFICSSLPQSKEEESGSCDSEESAQSRAIIDISGARYAVYDGLTADHLWLGVARVSESARIGGKGNCVIYGHRDSAFRCLKEVAVGDAIRLQTVGGEYIYEVEEVLVCAPQAEQITREREGVYLTMVTCYPFVYSGEANERYLVVCKSIGRT